MFEIFRLHHLFYVAFSLVISTVIFLPSVRMRFGLVEIALLTAIYAACFFRVQIPHIIRSIVPPIAVYGIMCYFFGIPFQLKLGLLHPIMTLWIWVFPILMATCLFERNSRTERNIIIGYNLILLLIIIIATAKAMLIFPDIMRMLTAGTTEKSLAQSMAQMNVGGFGIAYGCGAILLVLVALLINYIHNNITRTLLWGGIGLCGYIVLQAHFTTLLGLCIAGTAFILYISTDNPFTKIFCILIALLLLVAIRPLMESIIDYYQGSAVANHLQDLYDSWFKGKEYHSYRNEYFMNGVNLFLTNPLLGVNITLPENHFAYIASHSTVLGVATRSGIIGCFCYFYTYWIAAKNRIYKCSSPLRFRIYSPLIAYFLILSLLNPTELDVFNYCVGFISLVIISLILKQNDNTETTLEE